MTFEEAKDENEKKLEKEGEKFVNAQEEYKRQREDQRQALADYLKGYKGLHDAGLHVVTAGGAGKGRKDYTSHGRIPIYDLRNWKWVEVKDADKFDCVISLNMPDIDQSSSNFHALFDRIGLLVSYKKGSYDYEVDIYTDIDLPLDETKKEKIAQLVLEQYTLYQAKHKEG